MPVTILAESAAIAGLIGFAINQIKDCLKCLDMIATARNFGNTADALRNRFFVARYNLVSWANLVVDAQHNEQSPLRSLDWGLVRDTLGQLENLLTKAETMEKVYQFKRVEEEEILGHSKPEDTASKNFLIRALSKMNPKQQLLTSQILHDTTGKLVKVRWGFTGKTKFINLIEDVEAHVSAVTVMTTSRQLDFLVRHRERMLSDILVHAHTSQEAGEINEALEQTKNQDKVYYRTATTLSAIKTKRMQLGVDMTEIELQENRPVSRTNTLPKSAMIKGMSIHLISSLDAERAMAEYQGRRVFLEYKRMPNNIKDKLEHRIRSLGLLLKFANDSPLATLPCVGLYNDFTAERYTFLFNVPQIGNNPECSDVQIMTMRECMMNFQMAKPSLARRTRIARVIATAVRNLHAIGWLHKRIRSGNILFGAVTERVDFENSTAGPFLAGFGYARAANPTEFSEIPLTSTENDLYCHEAIVGPVIRSYRKIFDVFALGIFLIEAIIWKRFSQILTSAVRSTDRLVAPDELAQVILRKELLARDDPGSVMDLLRNECPPAYFEAIKLCLAEHPEDNWDDLDESLEIQNSVVEKLASISVDDETEVLAGLTIRDNVGVEANSTP